MILCPAVHPDYPDDWILVKQCDHDDQAGYLLAHLACDQYWQPTDRKLLVMAEFSHDLGSAYWDEYAPIDGEGKPWEYWNIPPDDHLHWHRGSLEVGCRIDPYVGLLISMHVVGIHRDRLGVDDSSPDTHIPINHSPRVDAFIDEQIALQARLLAEVERRRGRPLPRQQLMNDYKLLEMFDTTSVRLLGAENHCRNFTYVPDRDGAPMTVCMRPVSRWEFRLTPFPFAGDRLECPAVGRAVPRKVYRDDDEFRAAWIAAKTVLLPYACVR